jgi:hypothetical protein
LTLDGNDSNSDVVKVEGAVMATRLLGNFGRYSFRPLRISYKTGDDDNDEDDDDDDNNAEEADGVLMTVGWPTTPSRAATLTEN